MPKNTVKHVESVPKPTVLRVLLTLAGLAVVPLTILYVSYDWDSETAGMSENDKQDLAIWCLSFVVASFFLAAWLLRQANKPDQVTRRVPAEETTR